MGFDNECILNIQSLAGEYFCPVCRTLVYPHEAVQTQCTHLYCKPCLSYVVSSTQACPYDGYLVTEAGSKPLMESNKALAETIGKTTVHCLYHRSGCVWQGPLSECTSHCSGCTFGNSPVVCNRCGIQIVHRQVQEHAQTCNVNGTNTQSQGGGTAQDATAPGVSVSTDQTKTGNQAAPSNSQPQASHTVTGPMTVQNMTQPAHVNPLPQPVSAPPAVPTPDQQYYQQYQQYYQPYPGYDPYQQGYQQYYPYQQPPAQTQSQPQLQQQVQPPMQLQPQVQPLLSRNNQLPQAPVQGQPQISSNGPPQPLFPPPVLVGSGQIQVPVNPQQQPVAHGHMPPQPYLVQNNAQPHMQQPPYQMHPQPSQVQPPPNPQPHPPFQPPLQAQPQSQPMHFPVQSVGGPPTYQSQPNQPIQYAPPQPLPMQVQPSGPLPVNHFPPPPSQMRPPQPPHMLVPQQRPIIQPVPQPMAQQYMQQPQPFPGQTSGQHQGVPYNAGPFAQQQVRPLGPPGPPQPPVGYVQPPAMPHGMPPHPSQSYVGRPVMLNQGGQSQQQFDSRQPPVNPSNVNVTNQADHKLNQFALPERRAEQQEDKSPSMKKLEPVGGDSVTSFNEVKHEAGVNDERVPGNVREDDQRKDEALTKDGGVATIDSVKQGEASKNVQGSSEVNNNGNLDASLMEQGRSSHPTVPYGLPGQQQRPSAQATGQPGPNNLRPSGPAYVPYGSHQGEHFQPPGPNQPGQVQHFLPEPSFGGPPGPGPNNYPNNRGYEQQPTGPVRQGDPFGPPQPHGPNAGHPGPMESDMFRNQGPPNFDTRRPDSHFPGNVVDREPYGQPFGVDSSSMRMSGPPQGHESGPTRHHEQGPPHLVGEGSPKFGRYSSRPMSGHNMEGPSRFFDRDSDGYGFRNESGGRPPSASMRNDNRGRFDNNHHNSDFVGPMHGFDRHNMDRLHLNSPGNPSRPYGGPRNPDFDGREMERRPFGERYAMGPPGHMHRGEFDGPVKPRGGEPFGPRNMSGWGEPGFGSFQDYGPREPHGSGRFSHQPPFGDHLGEPGFRSNYSRQGFPNDGGFYPGGPDSFDPFRKKKTLSMGWCRICKVDCESVEGLDMHGQTREHQRMTMDMVINIKQKNAKKLKTSSDHSSREEASKFRKS
ncbi:uncharacterized protein [Rutidosis leptorrhynchoides]|uniref:uncharacterized protein n=1 Tax=Rutidosis leptorrhynchoides TaxID=125765 RepID=UPI003A994CCA